MCKVHTRCISIWQKEDQYRDGESHAGRNQSEKALNHSYRQGSRTAKTQMDHSAMALNTVRDVCSPNFEHMSEDNQDINYLFEVGELI